MIEDKVREKEIFRKKFYEFETPKQVVVSDREKEKFKLQNLKGDFFGLENKYERPKPTYFPNTERKPVIPNLEENKSNMNVVRSDRK